MGNTEQNLHWKQERQEVYNLSIMRFMRVLYANQLSQKNYKIYRFQKQVPNLAKLAAKAKEDSFYNQFPRSKKYTSTLSDFELDYYKK